ncbi:MAG: hypothetical protein PUH57_03710 [Prevotellaceae bacterium]|nr:hypothetical protein [Prevotellaceae bacterium]MDY2749750.1 hypothetical protein [Prevotella sp.]
MRIIKVLTFAAVAMMSFSAANAQDKVEGSVSADVVSRYVWRGQALGDAAVQPSASLSYKGLSLSAWGSYGFLNTEDTKEFDLTLSYTVGGFNVGVTDYWFSYYGADNKYFEYRAHDTSHVWEANVGYDFGPLAIQWYTNIAGADGINKSGKRAYSSYVQLSAPFSLATCDWTATIGAVPYATSFYSDVNGFAVTNVALRATKAIPVCKKWSLPLFMEGSCNPSTKKGYLVVGFTVAP